MRKLVKYSLIILKNNKNFKSIPSGDAEDDAKNPPQPEIVGKLRETIVGAYTTAYSANEMPFIKANYTSRRRLQDKSIALLNEMLALVEMSVPIFHMPIKRFGRWSAWIVCSRNQVQAWKESEYRRYRRMQADAERAAAVGEPEQQQRLECQQLRQREQQQPEQQLPASSGL